MFKAFLALFCILQVPLIAQKETGAEPGKFYIAWGYTRAVYSKSTLHFQNHNGIPSPNTPKVDYYDFYIDDAKAKDRPDFSAIPHIEAATIPQFVGRIGYYWSKREGLELNYDHTKYVVTDYQVAHVHGTINDHQVNTDTVLDPASFVHFEHTDGANFLMLNYLRKWDMKPMGKHTQLSWILKPGAGIVIPRTDVTLFGQHLNNDWKVAGYIMGVEGGLRAEFYKHLFFELVSKGSFANYVNAFALGKGNGKVSHHFFCGQITATIGFAISGK
ncbi:MAG TPA: hypothetical protein PLQ93_04805 [Bacteroidia bacterium]|nr:hypothetical protein [Bacteroidia bacterium]